MAPHSEVTDEGGPSRGRGRGLVSFTLRVNDSPLDELGVVLATALRFVAVRVAQIVTPVTRHARSRAA